MNYETHLHYDCEQFALKLGTLMKERNLVDKKGKPSHIELYNLFYPNDKISTSAVGQAVIDKTRKFRDWINGKHFPKDLQDLLKLCNVLDCDIEYLFCEEVEHATRDEEFICNYLGLDKYAVRELHEYKNTADTYDKEPDKRLSTLSKLITMNIPIFYDRLLPRIDSYIHAQELYNSNVNKKYKSKAERNQTINNSLSKVELAELHLQNTLREILNQLTKEAK